MKMKKLKWVTGAIAAVMLTSTASATVVFSDDFNDGFAAFDAAWDGVIAVSGLYTPDYVTDNAFCGGSGVSCLDMDGSGAGSLADITTASGIDLGVGDYTFSYDYGHNQGSYLNDENTLIWEVLDGASILATGSTTTGPAADHTYASGGGTFTLSTAVTGAKIRFLQTSAGAEGTDDGGTILDNVSMSVSVPEPGMLALLGLGLLGLRMRNR